MNGTRPLVQSPDCAAALAIFSAAFLISRGGNGFHSLAYMRKPFLKKGAYFDFKLKKSPRNWSSDSNLLLSQLETRSAILFSKAELSSGQ